MLRAGVIVSLLAFAAACQCVPRCDGVNCQGCCDSSGECQQGTHTLACGVDGQRCFTCVAGQQTCSNGGCIPQSHGAVGLSGGGGAGVSTGSNGGSGGATGGGAPGGGAPQPYGNLLATIGRPCSALADTPGGECSAELTCLPVLGTSRFACQYACSNGSCGGSGRCELVVEAGRSCTECSRPCGAAPCLPDEVCVPRSGGSVCMPNCRLVGAQCPAPQVCLASGLCSGGGLVSYCLRF